MSHFQKSTPFNIATLGIRSGLAITISTEGILEPGIVIVDAPGALVLTSFNIDIIDIDVAVETAELVLTSFDHRLLPGEFIEIDTERLSLTGSTDIAVNVAISIDTDILRGILANEIHIYLINPILVSTVDSFGFKLIGIDALPSPGGEGNLSGRRGRVPHAQDFSLQGWVSTDKWGRGQDPRSMLTRRNNDETIRFLSTDFIAANNIDQKTLDELERIYPGTIHIFDKSDPDIYMHVKNVTGIQLFYQLINDTENFNVYLRHLNLIPVDLDVIC